MRKRGLSTTDAIWLLVGMVAVAVIVVVGYNYYGELEEEDIPGNVTNMTNQTVEESCILTNAIWGADYVFIDEEVTLTVFGEDCDGEDLRVEIFDSSDELVNEVEGIQLENGIAIMEWEAGSEWEGGIYLLLIPILTIYVMGTYRVRTMRHYEMFFLIVTILVIVGLLLAFSSRVQYQPVVEETYYFTAVLESNSSMFVQSPELDVGEQVIPESCGNEVVDEGEECDDGNSDNNDECLNSCLLASCGDGLVWDGEEECDDGDSDNSDQCMNSCQLASCGDGIVQQGVEECDDGNDVNSDACTNSCEVGYCGDGIVQQGVEECDDGNDIDTDLCSNSCVGQQEILWPPEQEPEKSYSYSWIGFSDGLDIDNIVPVRLVNFLSVSEGHVNGIVNDVLEMPEGHRVILPRKLAYHNSHSDSVRISMHANPDDACRDESGEFVTYINSSGDEERFVCIWWDNGVEEAIDRFSALFSAVKGNLTEAGVEGIDAIILDSEKWLHTGAIKQNNGFAGGMDDGLLNQLWQAIEADPRFSGVEENLSQELIDLGYEPEDARLNDTVWQSGDDANCDQSEYNCEDNHLVWFALMNERIAEYRNEAIFDNAKLYFPDVIMSDFNIHYYDADSEFPTQRGNHVWRYGTGSHIGTHQSRSFYGQLLTGIANTGLPYFQPEPFNSFRYEVNKMRLLYLGNPSIPIHPWIAPRSWGSSASGNEYLLQNNDLHQEMILHLGLSGTDTFLYWNCASGPPCENDDMDDVLQSNLQKELDLLTNYQGVETEPLLNALSPWDKEFVYTGMNVDTETVDYRVWRFTPRMDVSEGDSIDDFILTSGNVSGNDDVVFQVGDEQVVFENAIIFVPEEPVSPVQGAWVIQEGEAVLPYLE